MKSKKLNLNKIEISSLDAAKINDGTRHIVGGKGSALEKYTITNCPQCEVIGESGYCVGPSQIIQCQTDLCVTVSCVCIETVENNCVIPEIQL